MSTLRDFRKFDKENQIWQWSDFSTIGPDSLPLSSKKLGETLGTAPQEDPILRVGQFWMSNGINANNDDSQLQGETGNIFEILGFQDQPNGQTLIAIRKWKPAAPSHPGDWTTRGTQVFCPRSKDNILCSSSLSLHHVDELFGDNTLAITLGPTQILKPTFAMKRTVVMFRNSSKQVLSSKSANQHAHWIDDRETRRAMNIIINDPHGFDIFTDGHWKLTGSGIEDVVQSKRPWELYTGLLV